MKNRSHVMPKVQKDRQPSRLSARSHVSPRKSRNADWMNGLGGDAMATLVSVVALVLVAFVG